MLLIPPHPCLQDIQFSLCLLHGLRDVDNSQQLRSLSGSVPHCQQDCWPVMCPSPFPVSITQPMPAPARRADGQAVSSLISYGDIFLFVAHKLQEQVVYETDIWHWLVKIPLNQFLWWHQDETHKLCFIPSL